MEQSKVVSRTTLTCCSTSLRITAQLALWPYAVITILTLKKNEAYSSVGFLTGLMLNAGHLLGVSTEVRVPGTISRLIRIRPIFVQSSRPLQTPHPQIPTLYF